VVKQPKTEEEIKDDIFRAYSEFRNETSSDRRQVYFQQFWEATHRWCDDYFFKKKQKIQKKKKAQK